MTDYIAPAQTRIGHVHLKVSDLDRSLDFYTRVLGFQLVQRYGSQAAFVSAGGYHHLIGLNTWQSKGGTPPPPRTTGLFHVAILFPTRRDLAVALKNLVDNGVTIDGVADHGVSEAIYFRDPDENGIEIYWDRPENEWPRDSAGQLEMVTDPLDVQGLLATIEG
ncbi:MAG: VOC family protein [Armatimonadetes bacterium]|nr:VOC family protein [Armatimonadota bacterium]